MHFVSWRQGINFNSPLTTGLNRTEHLIHPSLQAHDLIFVLDELSVAIFDAWVEVISRSVVAFRCLSD